MEVVKTPLKRKMIFELGEGENTIVIKSGDLSGTCKWKYKPKAERDAEQSKKRRQEAK